MKKCNYIAILSLATLCLGCTERLEIEEMPGMQGAINFSASQAVSDERPASRGTAPFDFVAGNTIGIFACYRTAEDTTDDPSAAADDAAGDAADVTNSGLTPNFMNNQPVRFDGTVWTYSPVKYWPPVGSVEFCGYYPYNESLQPGEPEPEPDPDDPDKIVPGGDPSKDPDGNGEIIVPEPEPAPDPQPRLDRFVHECKTGFEPLYYATAKVTVDGGKPLGPDNIGADGKLQLNFRPLVNKVNFTATGEQSYFQENEEDLPSGYYSVYHYLIVDFRVWGLPRTAEFSMTDQAWTDTKTYYTSTKPLTLELDKKTMDGVTLPGYTYDPVKGYNTQEAVAVSTGEKPKAILGKPARFIPLMPGVAEDDVQDPGFEIKYVLLISPDPEKYPNKADDYLETETYTATGSLKEIFSGRGLIENNININFKLKVDGITVSCDHDEYEYKPMF